MSNNVKIEGNGYMFKLLVNGREVNPVIENLGYRLFLACRYKAEHESLLLDDWCESVGIERYCDEINEIVDIANYYLETIEK